MTLSDRNFVECCEPLKTYGDRQYKSVTMDLNEVGTKDSASSSQIPFSSKSSAILHSSGSWL